MSKKTTCHVLHLLYRGGSDPEEVGQLAVRVSADHQFPVRLRFGIQGSGFRVQGSGFRVQGPWFRVLGPWFRVQGPWSMVHGRGSMVQGSGFRVHGSWFTVQSSWFRVQGSGLRFSCFVLLGARTIQSSATPTRPHGSTQGHLAHENPPPP